MSPEMKDGIIVGAVVGFLPVLAVIISLLLDFIISLVERIRALNFKHSNDFRINQKDLAGDSLRNFYKIVGNIFVDRLGVSTRIGSGNSLFIIKRPLVNFRGHIANKAWKWFRENG